VTIVFNNNNNYYIGSVPCLAVHVVTEEVEYSTHVSLLTARVIIKCCEGSELVDVRS